MSVLLADSFISFETGQAEIKKHTKVVDEFLSTGFMKVMDVMVRENEYSYTDSLFMNSQTDGSFYSFSNEKHFFRTDPDLDHNVMQIYVIMDYRKDLYEMNLYTFWDMIGVVGGIYEVMKVMSGMLISIFAGRMMSVDLLNSYNNKSGNDHDGHKIGDKSDPEQNRPNMENNDNEERQYTYCDTFLDCFSRKRSNKKQIQDRHKAKHGNINCLRNEIQHF